MSLKRLLNRVKQGNVISNGKVLQEDGKVVFGSIKYSLNSHQLPMQELSETLEQLQKIIYNNIDKGSESFNTEDTKGFLLKLFELAFSQESRAVGCFHPSEISTEENPCTRKMYFQKCAVPKDDSYIHFTSDNRMQRLVDLGTMEHLYIQYNLNKAGVLKAMETPVVDDSIGIKGKADGEIEFYGEDDLGKFYDEDMILEVKTINSYGFSKLRKPKPEHIKQASIYGGILGYKHICFIYICKDNSEHKTFVHPINYTYFNEFKKMAKEIVDTYNSNVRQSRSSDINKHKNIPCRVCPTITTIRASECAYKNFCFRLKN